MPPSPLSLPRWGAPALTKTARGLGQDPALANTLQFLPTRVLDDWMRARPGARPVLPDDLNAFTLVALRALLKRQEEKRMITKLARDAGRNIRII